MTKIPPDQLEFARAGWKARKSASIIAKDLNAQFGTNYSRSAVLGIAYRNDFGKRESKGPWRDHRVPKDHKTPKLPPPRADLGEPAILGPEGDFPPPGACKWIVQDMPEFRCCGQPSWQGKPYCEHHAAKARGVQPKVAPKNLKIPY